MHATHGLRLQLEGLRQIGAFLLLFIVAAAVPVSAQDSKQSASSAESNGILRDVELYATAPSRWDTGDWLFLGGSIASIGIAHHYDENVRRHFVDAVPTLGQTTNTHDLGDAAPAAVAFFGTWAFATLTNDSHGRHETWSMAEAAALSTVTSFALKFAAGRQRPNETTDANSWRTGGDSFPSLHTTAAFAIGAVLAESGNDDYRWVRRVLGYGIGIATGYQRLKHNAHWLSDDVAGAALGIAAARFVVNRDAQKARYANFFIVPLDGGLQLSYAVALH